MLSAKHTTRTHTHIRQSVFYEIIVVASLIGWFDWMVVLLCVFCIFLSFFCLCLLLLLHVRFIVRYFVCVVCCCYFLFLSVESFWKFHIRIHDVCVITEYVVVVPPPSAFILAQVLLEIIIAVATDTKKSRKKSKKKYCSGTRCILIVSLFLLFGHRIQTIVLEWNLYIKLGNSVLNRILFNEIHTRKEKSSAKNVSKIQLNGTKH